MKRNIIKTAEENTEERIVWASFLDNSLEEILEPDSQERHPDGKVTATKVFVVVERTRFGDEEEWEYKDLREAWNKFACVCLADFCSRVYGSFDAHDSEGDPYDFKVPPALKPFLKLADKLKI